MTNDRHCVGCASDASDAAVGELRDVAIVVDVIEANQFVVGPVT